MKFLTALSFALGIICTLAALVWMTTKPARWLEWRQQRGGFDDEKQPPES